MTFKVMTWNVEILFRPGLGAAPAQLQEYQRKLALLAEVINSQAPDVVAFQEVGGAEPLLDLQQALGGGPIHAGWSRLFPTAGVSG